MKCEHVRGQAEDLRGSSFAFWDDPVLLGKYLRELTFLDVGHERYFLASVSDFRYVTSS